MARTFFNTPESRQLAQANIEQSAWAAGLRDRAVQAAQPWLEMSDDQLWSLMFGHTLRRSWTVWSNGHCPACQQAVPMYTWVIEPLKRPWKLRCPHCGEIFPKNDFEAFYRSGLDRHGVFDAVLAERRLLFNTTHPDPADPLHLFGVDDGNGYAEGERRWWFIATYLIYGQWKSLVVDGARRLSVAYALTGDRRYAHKTGILLDRVADLYPSFDFKIEGVVYEGPADAGYVSTWHDACEEVRELALAYDRVYDALALDQALCSFLDAKAQAFDIEWPKNTPQAVCDNIERGILQDTLAHLTKIRSNYPRTEIAEIVIRNVLGGADQQARADALLDTMLDTATSIDGVTGEKGLAAYASFTIQGVAMLLALFDRTLPGFLEQILQRHPQLHAMFRFHIDTWVWMPAGAGYIAYYPQVGDSESFAEKTDQYVGVKFAKDHELESLPTLYALAPSMFTFLWRLYTLTGDAAFVQVMFRANGNTTDGLPYDLFAADPPALQRQLQDVIDREGIVPQTGSVNKQQWHLAILRAPEHSGAAWLKYDTGLRHGHQDGLNIGLFAKGLDLLPDFGYPPVHRGGWRGPRYDWYVGTLSHNTVVVDGAWQAKGAGKTTLWIDAPGIRAIRAAAPELIGGGRYERTVVMVDLSPGDFYLVDVFRVRGGHDHAWFLHSHFANLTTVGLHLRPADEYGHGSLMRNLQVDAAPPPGWLADWKVEDKLGYLATGADVHLRCTHFTSDAQAGIAEAWVSVGGFNSNAEAWIPRLMVRRQLPAGQTDRELESNFVSVIEPYAGQSNVTGIRRVRLPVSDGHACIEVAHVDGRRDVLMVADPQAPDWPDVRPVLRDHMGLDLAGEVILAQYDSAGQPLRTVGWA